MSMNRLIPICGALALAAVALGEDFPLTYRAIPPEDVMSFPGNSGTYAQLRPARPSNLRREPKVLSSKALYGECGDTRNGPAFLVRLDESKGDAKGYDQLLVDMNQNGDLTDDPVARRVVLTTERQTGSRDMLLFGPIQAPAAKVIGGGRPVYYAQVYLYQSFVSYALGDVPSSGGRAPTITSGQLTFKAGWYLDTTVTLDGLKQKVGVLDGNSNLRLGDVSQPATTASRGEKTWYFRSGDSLLTDEDGSGTFDNNPFQSEACPFGPILYLGAKPCKVTLAADGSSLRLGPWPQALAEVALQPHGDQVRSLTLAWERPGGQWELIRPVAADGKVQVPAGNYRLYACSLEGKGGGRDQVMVSAMRRTVQAPVSFAPGKANTLDCGAPLEIKVTATKSSTSSRQVAGDTRGNRRAELQPTVRIGASLTGAGGEVYSTYYRGEGFKTRPPKPAFQVADAAGKTVASGSLEYG
jgi:hypothetical protein